MKSKLSAGTYMLAVFMLIPMFIFRFIDGCDIPIKPDTNPPVVHILQPHDGDAVSGMVEIKCRAVDDLGMSHVELWVDRAFTGIADSTAPYVLLWNTMRHENNSTHVITVRAYDTSKNKTDSHPISLTIDNPQNLPPTPSRIYEIVYQDNSFYIRWSRCPDRDFGSYTLFESYAEDMAGEQRVFRSESKSDTSFEVTGVNPGEVRYYQVEVADSAGLMSRGNISEAKSFSTFLYYLFNGNTLEEGGSGFDGINNGVTFAPDRFGNENSAAFFDGHSYIQLPDEIRFKPFKSASIAFWMKTEQKGQFYIMDQRIGSHSPDNYNFGIIFNLTINRMNRIQFNYPGYNSTREYSLEELPIYNKIHNNEWQHFVFIKDATEEKYYIYINGQYFSRERIKDLDFEINGRLLIGKNYLYKYYNGVFDDLYIFDRRISEEEILELYDATP